MSRPIIELRIIPEASPPAYPHGATDPELAARRRAYAVTAYQAKYTLGEIALALGVTCNRVAQILKKEKVRR